MRPAFLIPFFICSLSQGFGQSDTASVPFVAYWSIGDQFQFKVEKTLQQWKDGVMTKDQNSSYRATFNVVDSTATSYTIHWTYDMDMENELGIPTAMAERFANFSKMEFQYRTDELGSFIELENWEEISAKMKELFAQLTDALSEGDPGMQAKAEAIVQPMIPFFSSKEALEQLVMKEVQLIHYPFGVEFSQTIPLEYDEQLPNLFGGDPIKARSRVSITKVDTEEMRCVLEHKMIIDPKDMKAVILQVMEKMELDDKEMQKQLKSARYDVTSINSFDYFYDIGLPVSIIADRETIISMGGNDGKRIDRTTIELIQ